MPGTESERTLLDAPIGSRLGSPEARLEGCGLGLKSVLWEGIPRGQGLGTDENSPKGTGAGRWPGSGLAHSGGSIRSLGKGEGGR